MSEPNLGPNVAVVLGGGMKSDGTPGEATIVRAQAGAKLAHDRPHIYCVILSGGRALYETADDDHTEAEVMADILEELGIEHERLALEDQSKDTIGNAVLVSARYLLNQQPRPVYIVTSPFHLRRAVHLFQHCLTPEWQVIGVASAETARDHMRAAHETEAMVWVEEFFAGIAPGDLHCIVERLRERDPFYASLPWLDPDRIPHENHRTAPNTVTERCSIESEANMCMADNGQTKTVPGIRLPGTVVPTHYKISIAPDIAAAKFAGEETIDIRVKQAVSEIVLHAAELTISEATVTGSGGTTLVGAVSFDEVSEQATIKFDGIVGKGKWKLRLKFEGILNDKLHGFYRSVYKDATGSEHVIASTQFEPNDAHRAFPCFDEPAMKATFGITLIVDEHLTAISNGPVVATKSLPGGKKEVRFKNTMKMASYIVAFVVGEFECTEAIMVNGTAVRVYHVPGKAHLTTFALKAAQFSLTWYEKYFGIRYPGDKLDLIGIPDFAFGAMENLGCVTFRETALLVNEKTGTIAELSRVAEVVAHEIAHMWFGDLVTMKWWNGLWLNEAFATFMATKVEDAFRKEWQRWVSFGIERAAAFRTDGLAATRPIEAPVVNPADSLGMIDVITYRKGCSVLRQLEQFIGEETFRAGIASYLAKHAYDNAETSDLWDAIDSVSDKPVRQIMDSWIFQGGHPVVTVSESAVSGCVTLTQSPFKYLSEAIDPAQSWLVPVNLRYKTADGVGNQWALLDGGVKTIYLGENLEWVVANAGGHGFYRTRYSAALAAKIMADVQGQLSAIERFNLINDAWACAQAGLINGADYLSIVKQFSAEADPNVWGILTGSLSRIHGLLTEASKPQFEAMVRDLIRPALARLGWSEKAGESSQDRQLRGSLIGALGIVGNDEDVHAKAKELFAAYQSDKESVPSDVVPAIVSLVAHTGGQAEYDLFLSLFQSSTGPQEQVRFLSALAGFRDEKLLAKTLSATISGVVRTQDAPQLVARLMSNDVIGETTWDFMREHWDTMIERFPETGVISMVSGITALATPELEAEAKEFFATHTVKGGAKAIAQYLEMLRIAVAFNTREAAELNSVFAPAPVQAPTAPAK